MNLVLTTSYLSGGAGTDIFSGELSFHEPVWVSRGLWNLPEIVQRRLPAVGSQRSCGRTAVQEYQTARMTDVHTLFWYPCIRVVKHTVTVPRNRFCEVTGAQKYSTIICLVAHSVPDY
jgi:hypothetical protein